MHHESVENAEKAPLLDLTAPRTVRLTVGKQPVDFTFRRITDKDWRTFFEGVISRVETKNGERTNIETEDAALAELVEKTLSRVNIDGAERTQAPIPPRFKIAAGIALRMASATADEADILSELSAVKINAAWTLDEKTGKMMTFVDLIHRFRQPSIEQLRRYKMGVARVKVTGDAKNGTTVYPSRLAVALSLYDELIAEVEGYAEHGRDLQGTEPARPDVIAAHMDGFHKAIAVRELFERSEEQVWIGDPETKKPEGEADGEGGE